MDGTALFRNRLLIDRAVFFAAASRIWQFLAGGVSLLLVARFFSPELQGFYYTFSSLLAIQTIFDLGLTGVLTYVASHEWGPAETAEAQASADARQRLGELLTRSRRWYLFCAIAFSVVAFVVGCWLYRDAGAAGVDWLLPWALAVAVSGFSLWLMPSIAILEGCNFVAQVNAYRLTQAVVGNLVVWTTILLGGGLWAVVASAGVRLAFEILLVARRFRSFFATIRSAAAAGRSLLGWKEELLPLQWRIALQSIAAFLALQLYTPIIFKYHGPALGGQMGMTWSAITTLQLAAFAWIQTRIPQIGRLISERRFAESKRHFLRAFAVSVGVYVTGGALFVLALILLGRVWPALADRLLDPGTTLLLEVAIGLNLVVSGLGTYVRAWKIDPFVWIGVGNAAVVGVFVWWLGATIGPAGAAAAHIAVTTLVMLPATILIFRRTGGAT